jgi:hypothetical protein
MMVTEPSASSEVVAFAPIGAYMLNATGVVAMLHPLSTVTDTSRFEVTVVAEAGVEVAKTTKVTKRARMVARFFILFSPL